ncbi:MAG: hypothetical protein ABIZ91_16700 [Gemmatimonadaceae bacterium]
MRDHRMGPSHAIRFAMMLGVLLFGGVTWFLRQSGEGDTMDQSLLPSLLWIARGLWVLAIAGCIGLFGVLRNTTSPARVSQLSIIGWALGESVALLGGVVWFVTGSPAWYLPGVVFLLLTFVAFPGRRS